MTLAVCSTPTGRTRVVSGAWSAQESSYLLGLSSPLPTARSISRCASPLCPTFRPGPQKVNGRHENQKCLRLTRAGRTYSHGYIKMQCYARRTREGGSLITNLEIFPQSPRGAVYLGVADMNQAESIKRGRFREVFSTVSH